MSEGLSIRNPKVERVRQLTRDRQERESSGLAVLEGVRLAEEAVAAGLSLAYALYTEELSTKERGAALLTALRETGAPLYQVSPQTLAKTADTRTPQGIIALFAPRVLSLATLGPGLVLLLDNLQDPGNLGTVIRTTEAFGGAGVVVCGGVDPYNPKVIRSAMGSLFRLPVIKAPLEEALAALRLQGRPIYLADAGGVAAPWELDLRGDAVLVIGNEGAGPTPAAHAAATAMVSIPMPGLTESLNAGVAASLLIYEAMRQRKLP